MSAKFGCKELRPFFILPLFLLFVFGCAADEPAPTPTAIVNVTAVPSATPTASPTPQPTLLPATPTFTAALTVTVIPTLTPMPTATATPSLPSASVLFVHDNALQQWLPQSDEVKVLVGGVHSWPQYANDIAVFMREISPEEDALIVFDIPTQTEYEVFRTSTVSLARTVDRSITVSPNGRWLAYASAEGLQDPATIFTHEILRQAEGITVSPPILTLMSASPWVWPYEIFSWATPDELSWSNKDGIWAVDLNRSVITPIVVIAPSKNTYQVPPMNPADQDKGPGTAYSHFLPHVWSPDGHYLLVVEYFFEDGILRVLERDTNRSVEIPGSGVGPISDEAIWIDDNTLLHFNTQNAIQIWKMDVDADLTLLLEKSFPLPDFWMIANLRLVNNHLLFSSGTQVLLYDLDLETGQLVEIFSDSSTYIIFGWSPDNQYALWGDSKVVDNERTKPVFLMNLNEDIPRDMSSVFGVDSCCWHWYE